MPFRRRAEQPRDLLALIESELRERIEEAVDDVALDALVQRRRARRLPAPVATSTEDRAEFEEGAQAFLERLTAALLPTTDAETRRRAEEALVGRGDPRGRLLGAQLVLARRLPDYWQRFEAVRLEFATEWLTSRGERRGLLRRLLGR